MGPPVSTAKQIISVGGGESKSAGNEDSPWAAHAIAEEVCAILVNIHDMDSLVQASEKKYNAKNSGALEKLNDLYSDLEDTMGILGDSPSYWGLTKLLGFRKGQNVVAKCLNSIDKSRKTRLIESLLHLLPRIKLNSEV